MTKSAVHTDAAPAAIGTYSQAIIHGDTIWVSGQIGLDPATMELVAGGSRAQVEQVFVNLAAVADAAGSSLEHCLKLNVYLTDLGDFALVNEVMAGFFTKPYPARAAIGVAALPRGAVVEMDAVLARAD